MKIDWPYKSFDSLSYLRLGGCVIDVAKGTQLESYEKLIRKISLSVNRHFDSKDNNTIFIIKNQTLTLSTASILDLLTDSESIQEIEKQINYQERSIIENIVCAVVAILQKGEQTYVVNFMCPMIEILTIIQSYSEGEILINTDSCSLFLCENDTKFSDNFLINARKTTNFSVTEIPIIFI